MAVFDVSFANKKTAKGGGSGGYGVLIDQLDILESSLSSDGNLTPGDYKLLASKAQELYAHPGLSADQRSNISVKVARYQSQGKQKTLKDNNDVARLNREIEDDNRKSSMLLGNDPTKFLRAQAAAKSAKVAQLAEAIDSLEFAGDDSSSHVNEYNAALSEYQDTLEALEYVENHQPGSAPASGYVAYMVTNNSGEIVDVKVAREGSVSGYLETNGMYGGLKIYGKLNRKDNGANVFLLGNKTFRAPDTFIPGPDGTLKTSILSDVSTQKGGGPFKAGTSVYVDVDSSIMKTQSAIRAGGYAEGSKGFIYRKNEDGTYTKYANSDIEKLGISENDVIKIPSSLEQSILGSVMETVDLSKPTTIPFKPAGATMNAPVDFTKISTTPAPAPAPTSARPATAPTERAPQTSQGIAGRAVSAAKGFMGRIFGGGQQ